MRSLLLLVPLLAALLGSFPGSALAQLKPMALPAPTPAPAPAGITPQQAQSALDVLGNEGKRNELISTLQVIVKAQQAAAGPAAPGVAAVKSPIPLAPNSLGAAVLVDVSQRLSTLSGDMEETFRTLTDFPLLVSWLTNVASDPASRMAGFAAGWRLVVVLGVGLAAEVALWRALRSPIARLAEIAPGRRKTPDSDGEAEPSGAAEDESPRASDDDGDSHDDQAGHQPHAKPSALVLLRRLPYVIGRVILDLLPVLTLAAVSYLLGNLLADQGLARQVIFSVVYATILLQTMTAFTRMCVAPDAPHLRLFHISDESARYCVNWVRRIVAVAVFGYAVTEVALMFGLYAIAHDALLKIVALVVHLMLVVVVLQCRAGVARRIRAKPGARGAVAVLRNRLARIWHIIAIFYIIAFWLVWAFEVENGIARLVRFFVAAAVVGTIARLVGIAAVGALDRALHLEPSMAERYPGLQARARNYLPAARLIVSVTVTAAAVVALLEAWGIDSLDWFGSDGLGGRLAAAGAMVGFIILVSLLVWELANGGIERHLARLTREAQSARSARLRTLLPMMRTALFVTIILIAGLMILSQIGVNVAPLLAGAGVVGLAIGFGSQKLVQDIITGLFLLLENAMQVGDVVSLGGLSGTVENLSVRTIRLRALDGSVHIIPFSAVTTVTNMTRDFSYALIDVSVGLNEAPDAIGEMLRDVVRDMRKEPRWQSAMRDELEVLGVDRFIDLAWVLRVRVKTLPSQRWAVARELNKRFKICFDDNAIESPFTSHRILSSVPPPPPALGVKAATEEPAKSPA